jgi:hypothetical protein
MKKKSLSSFFVEYLLISFLNIVNKERGDEGTGSSILFFLLITNNE